MADPTTSVPSAPMPGLPAHRLESLISQEQIAACVSRLALEIADLYQADQESAQIPLERREPPLLVGVLKGASFFLADLVRVYPGSVHLDFMRARSYGAGMTSSGEVRLLLDVETSLENRWVMLLEDIVDTGQTLHHLVDHLSRRRPQKVRTCVLLDKPSRRELEIQPDLVGLTIPDKFVVGYGLDWNEYYRELQDIRVVELEASST